MFLPIRQNAGVDLVWIAVLIALNLQSSFLTPPFGWSLFFLRGVAPKSVATTDICRGAIPFILLQGVSLMLVFFSPKVATRLPKAIGW